MPDSTIPIVLTGSIVPNAPFTKHSDPKARRDEYLKAIDFYRAFAPVYFLENSSYDLSADPDFNAKTNFACRKTKISDSPERGKGFQEFEMLDNWLANESSPPPRWIKITGRYIYRNFNEILEDCRSETLKDRPASMIIDRRRRSRKALSYLFCVDTSFYLSRLKGIYSECDDNKDEWIERVLYRHLIDAENNDVRLFSVEPRLTGIGGSWGEKLETGAAKHFMKKALRKINAQFDASYLRFTR